MNKRRFIKITVWLLGFALGAGLGIAIGQQTPPAGNKGVSGALLQAVDLGPEIEGMQGWQLRLRKVTFEPGGVFGIHSHKDRPGVVYVLQGTVINHRDGAATVYRAGDTWLENKETNHWVENKGTKPAVVIPCDIAKKR